VDGNVERRPPKPQAGSRRQRRCVSVSRSTRVWIAEVTRLDEIDQQKGCGGDHQHRDGGTGDFQCFMIELTNRDAAMQAIQYPTLIDRQPVSSFRHCRAVKHKPRVLQNYGNYDTFNHRPTAPIFKDQEKRFFQ